MGFLDYIFGKSKRKAEEAKRLEKERIEAERKAREEAERRAIAERKAKEEAERKAKEDAERKAKEEAERKAKEDAERKAKEEAERKAKEDAERKAKEEAERKAKEDAERKAKKKAERKAKEEANKKEKEEQQRKRECELRDTIAKAKAATDNEHSEFQMEIIYNPDKKNYDSLQKFVLYCNEMRTLSPSGLPYLAFKLNNGKIEVSGFVSHKLYYTINNAVLQELLEEYDQLIGRIDKFGDIGLDRISLFVTFSLVKNRIPFETKVADVNGEKGKRILLKVPKNGETNTLIREYSNIALEYGPSCFPSENALLTFVNVSKETMVYLLALQTFLCKVEDNDIYQNICRKKQVFGSINTIVGHDHKYCYFDVTVVFDYKEECEGDREEIMKYYNSDSFDSESNEDYTNEIIEDDNYEDCYDEEFDDDNYEDCYDEGIDDDSYTEYSQHIEIMLGDEYENRIKPIKNGNITLAIVGMQYRNNYDSILDSIKIGTHVKIEKEQDNEFDDDAWAFYLEDGTHIGYVSRKEKPFAKLFLKHCHLDATICSIKGNWIDAEIQLSSDMIDESALDLTEMIFTLIFDKAKTSSGYQSAVKNLTLEDLKNYIDSGI